MCGLLFYYAVVRFQVSIRQTGKALDDVDAQQQSNGTNLWPKIWMIVFNSPVFSVGNDVQSGLKLLATLVFTCQ